MTDLAPIEARINAATAGPWEVLQEHDPKLSARNWREIATPFTRRRVVTADYRERRFGGEVETDSGVRIAGADADLIAHAPTDLRDLCDEVKRLREVADHAGYLLAHLDHIGMTREEDELMDNLRTALEACQ